MLNGNFNLQKTFLSKDKLAKIEHAKSNVISFVNLTPTSNVKAIKKLKNFVSSPFKQAPLVFADDNSPITLFFTKNYCFSNHYICDKLIVDGVSYVCTEQYYMYYKAAVFGDQTSANAIMKTNDPKTMKRIGSEIIGFIEDIWSTVSITVMVIASIHKYEQNPELRRQLFQTADTLLVEASPTDKRWGVGLSMDSELIRMKSLWRGKNIMGRLLTKLRDRLLERKEFIAEKNELLANTV